MRLISAILAGSAGLRLSEPLVWREQQPCLKGTAVLSSNSGSALELLMQLCDVAWSVSILDRVNHCCLVRLCGTKKHRNRSDGKVWPGVHVHVWTPAYRDNEAQAAWWPAPDSVVPSDYVSVLEGFCNAMGIAREPSYRWPDPPEEPRPTTLDRRAP